MLKNIHKLEKDQEDLIDIIERYRDKLEKVSGVDHQALNLLLACHQTRLWDIEAEIAERSRKLVIPSTSPIVVASPSDSDKVFQVSA